MKNKLSKTELYYQVTLDIALIKSDYALGFINISHIDYSVLSHLFKDQIFDEEFLFQDAKAYTIDEALYNKHKAFLDTEIPFKFDFELFEYSVALSSFKPASFKRCYHKKLPDNLKNLSI